MTVEEFEAMPRLSLGVLQAATGIDRRRLLRQLRADGVPVQRYGTRHVVDRAALRRLVPDLYEGIIDRLIIRQHRAG
jgi:hypothetical protein